MRLLSLFRSRRINDRRGNVLLLAAVVAVPLIGMIALAVDFGRIVVVKTALDLAADSAALLATTVAANAFEAGDTNAVSEGIAAATSRFRAQSGVQFQLVGSAPNVSLTESSGTFTAAVSYHAQEPTTFARVLGIPALSLSGQSQASLSVNPYVDIQILMDVSSSMTVAATPADITKMQTLTTKFKGSGPQPSNVGQNCAFACHWSSTYPDYYSVAVQNGVQLRITVLQSAVTDVITTLAAQDANQTFRLGLYTFSQGFNSIYPLSFDVNSGLSYVSKIVPDVNFCSTNCPDTYFTAAMQQMTALDQTVTKTAGLTPQRFLFIVTDGVYDQYSASKSRQINAFSPSDCAAIKALGVNVLVLYTPYLPLPTNSFYNTYVKPITPQIVPDLQSCASSPSYYFVANDAVSINSQLLTMLQLAIHSTGHLTH